MQLFIFKSKWNPYLAGALAGLLAVGSVVASTRYLGKPKYLGASTSFVSAAGIIESQIDAARVKSNRHYRQAGTELDWQMMFLVGIFLGSLVSSVAGGTFKFEMVPSIWCDFYGDNGFKRAFAAFLGGFISLYGARLAGGCPSGHGLSGMMQLALSSAVAMLAFMLGGIISATVIYRRSW